MHGIELYPEYTLLYSALAEIEAKGGGPEKAVAALESGLKATGRNPTLLQQMAEMLIDARQLKQAEQIIKELRGMSENARRSVDYLEARVQFVQEHWSAARQGFEKARGMLMMSPGLLKVVDTWIGECYGKTGDYDQQVQACRRALSTDPFYPPARAGVIDALRAEGRTSEALDEYGRLAKFGGVGPSGVITWTQMLLLNTLQQSPSDRDWGSVESALQQAEKLVPDSEQLPILRRRLHGARPPRRRGAGLAGSPQKRSESRAPS